jgi:hypothetical protein
LENFPYFFFFSFLFLPVLFFSFLPLFFSLTHAQQALTTEHHEQQQGPWSFNSNHGRLPWRASHKLVFLHGMTKNGYIYIYMTSLLLSPPLILSETNSNLRILRDSIFQLNSDFISNSNLNPFGLLPHPYISLGAPPPRIPMPIPPQNRALAATRVPPSSPLPVIAATCIPKPSLQIKPCAGREKPRT